MKNDSPKTAMVLAAGMGERMRPITATMPKPLVKVRGEALIDRGLDKLAAAGVERAVVNVHHFADMLEAHVRKRARPQIVISDERQKLLGTGAGIVNALPLIGDAPFFLLNSDSIWIDGVRSNLARLRDNFRAGDMDAMLLLSPSASSIGYDGRGDFMMRPDGRLQPRPERQVAPFIYAGAAILSPSLFATAPQGPFGLNLLFQRAAGTGRLYGLRLDGLWMHVGTPDAIAEAEAAILASAA